MATFADSLTTIRDNLVAEFAGETARRAALVAAGNPPPATYSSGGKSIQWNDYVSMMTAQIKTLNETVIAAGGDGGLYEITIQAYS